MNYRKLNFNYKKKLEFIVRFQNSVYRLVTHLVFYYHLQSFLNYGLRLRQVELPPIELRDQVFRIKDGVPLSPYPSPKSRTTGPLVIFGKNLGLRRELRMRKKPQISNALTGGRTQNLSSDSFTRVLLSALWESRTLPSGPQSPTSQKLTTESI